MVAFVQSYQSAAAAPPPPSASPRPAPSPTDQPPGNRAVAPASDPATETLPAKTVEASSFNFGSITSYIHIGSRLPSPYSFRYDEGEKKGFLDKSGDDPASFLELVVTNRWAWTPPRMTRSLAQADAAANPENYDLREGLDYEFRVNYNFDQSDSNASAVVGTGDFGFETYVNYGIPSDWFSQVFTDETNPAVVTGGASLGVEIGYGVVTQKSSFDSLQRGFAGLGFSSSYQLGSAVKPRWLLLQARLGYARLDTLEFIDETSREVATINGGLPDYQPASAFAAEIDLVYPLNEDAFLTAGGRIYNGPNPNPWTFYVGYTTSLTKIGKALFGFGADDEKTPSQSGGTPAPKPAQSPPPNAGRPSL